MAKYAQDQIDNARRNLADLKPGDTLYTKVTKVSRSGMSRRIEVYRVSKDGAIYRITWEASRILGWSMNDDGLSVGGCGMDMCFHTIYNLSYCLFPNGFPIIGTDRRGRKVKAKSEFDGLRLFAHGVKFRGRNRDPFGWDTNGGYALNKRDL